MKRRLITYLLTLTFILSSVTISYGAEVSFTDTNGSEWYYSDLQFLAGLNIISGTGSGAFEASKLLTKDALIKTLVTSSGYELENATPYWAQNYIDKAEELGWLKEVLDTPYTGPINRYETCRLIVNALGDEAIYPDNLEAYSVYIKDYDLIPESYKDVVLKVYASGIITGYPDGTFGGDNTLIRAEMTAIISRFMNPAVRIIPLEPVASTDLSILFAEDSPYAQSGLIKVVDSSLYYLDATTDEWLMLSDTPLTSQIADISEDTLVDIANRLYGQEGYFIDTYYGDSQFNWTLNTGETTPLMSFNTSSANKKITITIDELYDLDGTKLDDNTFMALNSVLNEISPKHRDAMFRFITENFIVITEYKDYIRSESFGNITVKVIADQWGFNVEFWIN